MGITPVVYRSTDTDAPQFTPSSDKDTLLQSFLQVIKTCLCDGYGSKPAAGWQFVDLSTDSRGHPALLLRTGSSYGTQKYWWIGSIDYSTPYISIGAAEYIADVNWSSYSGSYVNLGSTTGCSDKSNPRCATATNRLMSLTNVTYWSSNIPWVIVANEYLAFVIGPFENPSYTVLTALLAFGETVPNTGGVTFMITYQSTTDLTSLYGSQRFYCPTFNTSLNTSYWYGTYFHDPYLQMNYSQIDMPPQKVPLDHSPSIILQPMLLRFTVHGIDVHAAKYPALFTSNVNPLDHNFFYFGTDMTNYQAQNSTPDKFTTEITIGTKNYLVVRANYPLYISLSEEDWTSEL